MNAPVAWLTEIWMQEGDGSHGYWTEEVLPEREERDGFRNARPLYLHPAPVSHDQQWHEDASEAAWRAEQAPAAALERYEMALIKLRDAKAANNDAPLIELRERQAAQALTRLQASIAVIAKATQP